MTRNVPISSFRFRKYEAVLETNTTNTEAKKKLIVQIDKNGLIKGRELRICKEPITM